MYHTCREKSQAKTEGKEMRKIAVANRKGGVAKTTTAVHLVAALNSVDMRVLLIDTDTQGQCARMLGIEASAGLQRCNRDVVCPRPEQVVCSVTGR